MSEGAKGVETFPQAESGKTRDIVAAEDNRRREEGTLVAVVRGIKQ